MAIDKFEFYHGAALSKLFVPNRKVTINECPLQVSVLIHLTTR